MYTMCQRLYTFGLEVKFTRVGDFTWRVSDCEEYGVLRSQSAALDALGVKCIYLDNSGPEILLLQTD